MRYFSNFLQPKFTTEFYNYKNGGPLLTANNKNSDYMFTLLVPVSPLIDGLSGPMFDTIIPKIEDELSVKRKENYPILAVLLVVGIIIEILIFI